MPGRDVFRWVRPALLLVLLLLSGALSFLPGAGAQAPQRRAGEIAVNPVDGAQMVWVPAGTFPMGSADGEADEKPVRRVTLTRGFWLYRTEVTNAQYAKFLAANPGQPEPEWWTDARFNAPEQPVVGMSWEEAAGYCRWARARLPSEAEWEHAARGPEGQQYPWGSAAPDATRAVFDLPLNTGAPAAVGGRAAGASWCGALDLAGNVWEWCADWYAPDYYRSSPASDPLGPPSGEKRVLRGGCWGNPASDLRASIRFRLKPEVRDSHGHGFRPARAGG